MLRQDGDDVKLIAGGQSLAPMMAMRLTRPSRLIDIDQIGALKFIAFGENVARTGACTRQSAIARDEALAAHVPLLRKALAWVGHVQTRNRGTVGGSLAHADPAAELPLVARVLDAQMVARSHKGTPRCQRPDFRRSADHCARAHDASRKSTGPCCSGRRTGSAFIEVSAPRRFCDREACAQIVLDYDGRCAARASVPAAGSRCRWRFPNWPRASTARCSKMRAEKRRARCNKRTRSGRRPSRERRLSQASWSVLAIRVLRAAYDEARSKP